MNGRYSALVTIAIGLLFVFPGRLNAQDDAAIRKKLIGYWRSPRHEYEYRADGRVFMDPNPPTDSIGNWKVEKGLFHLDNDTYVIVSLTDKRFVYKTVGDKDSRGYVMKRITKAMVGENYDRESIR
jgi:hypothetical protein